MSEILKSIRAHSQPERVRTIDVPEWGEVIHYRMVTLADMHETQRAAPDNPARQEAELICLKALKQDGTPMFKRIDVLVLLEEADPVVVRRIANAMIGRKSADDIEKN